MRKRVAATMLACAGLAFIGTPRTNAAESLKVVATIKPIHSLAAAVMEGAGMPDLLVKGAASEHTYSMKPSDARTLSNANIVVRVSENLETFLQKPIESISKDAKIVTLSDIPGMKLLPVREGGAFEAHEDEDHDHAKEKKVGAGEHKHDKKGKEDADKHDHGNEKTGHAEAGHDHESHDAHLWLSPPNAALIADHLAAVFAEARPDQAAIFRANAETLKVKLAKLDADLQPRLTALKGKDFIVFHDAFHYFEDHFGVEAAGSITLSPQNQPGAARLKEIRARIAKSKSVCVFSEPQFAPKLVKTVIEGTAAKTGVLDGLGADLDAGSELYFKLMTNLTASLEKCLG